MQSDQTSCRLIDMKPEKQIKIYNQLKLELFTGSSPNQKLPGETTLAKRFGVCRETIRGALNMLRSENIIRSSQGKCSRVNYLPVNIQSILAVNLRSHTLRLIAEDSKLKVISISDAEFNSLTDESLNLLMHEHKVGAVIIYVSGLMGSEDCCDTLNSLPVPVYVTMANKSDFKYIHGSGCYTSLPQWWKESLKYLHKMGHRRIASFVPLRCGSFHGIQYDDYIEMLAECAVDNRECYIFRPSLINSKLQEHTPSAYYKEIRNELKRMMELPQAPTALLCYSNQWAELVYKAAGELNISIPDQLSVMGFVSSGVELTPGLTTVNIDTALPIREFIRQVKALPMGGKIRRMVTPIPMYIIEKESVKNLNL